jgi:hypothetical protein
MMKKIFIHFVFLMLVSSVAFSQKAEPIVSWNLFTQLGGGEDMLMPTTMSTDVKSGGLMRGKGIAINNALKQPKYWGGKGFSANQDGPEDGIKKEKFISFSFTTSSAKSLSLEEIKPVRTRIFSIGPFNYTFQYSLDGINYTDIKTITVEKPSKLSDVVTPAINLSGIKDLQKIASGKTVFMRIIPWGAKGAEYNDFYLGSSYDYASLTVTGNFK